jgi:hypothetical protein
MGLLMAVIDEPITLFGGYVESASVNVGYGADSSTCQLTLVYDGDGPNRTISPEDNFPELGSVVGFKVGGLEFAGVLQRYTNKRSTDGYRWDIVLESPAKLLDGIQIILDGFQGTAFTGANPYNPGADTDFTNQINNIWNPFAVRENYDYGGIFGGSDVNSNGFPGIDALTLIEEISRGEHDFGGKAVFGESEFEVDLTELKDAIMRMANYNLFRIKGPVQSLNAIIQECCDLICYDYIVTIKPKTGSIENGLITNPVIKVKMIDKTSPPDPNAIQSIVTMYERQDKLVSADVGKELSDAVTQRMVIGGPATRYYTTSTATQVWGKTKDLVPQYVDYIVLDDGSQYTCEEMEVRCAMGSFETWILYHLIKQYKGQLNPIIAQVAPTLFSVIRIDSYTIGRIINGNCQMNELIDTTSKVWDERSKLFNGQTIRERLGLIHSAVENAGREYYGKKWFVPLPVEAGGIANNIKFITDDQEYITSWDIADSAYSEDIGFSDVSFYDSDGKLKAVAVWDYKPATGDYTSISSCYCLGAGGIATCINVDKDLYWAPSIISGVVPCACIDIPDVCEHDQYTTMENGLYWLLNIELGIGLNRLQRLAGFGSDGVFLNFPIAPARMTPLLFGIPQQSSRYSWGPWWAWNSLKGKAEVVIETSLSPETYGGYVNTNEVGHALCAVMNAEVTGVESGYVELADLPIGNIGDRFAASGPYVTNIDVAIGTDGVKTNYKFNTWTPQWGKLAKYNADRLAKINRSTIKFLQEQRNLFQKPAFRQPRFDLPIQKVRVMPQLGFMAGLFGIFTRGTNRNLTVQGQHPNTAMGPMSQNYGNSYGCTNEQLMTPVAVKRTLTDTNDDKPSVIKPTQNSTSSARFDSGHAGPTSKDLNPYFTHAETDFQLAVHGEDKQSSLDIQENRGNIEEVRVMGFKGPMLYSAWGYDLDGTTVPAKGDTGEDMYEFDEDTGTDRSLWKTGPVDFKWDDERKVWSGGPDFAEGILTSNITAPADPHNPTEFTFRVYRTSDWDDTKNETITCKNRDPSLSLTNVTGMIYVMAIRINYEWRAFWIGCPDLL